MRHRGQPRKRARLRGRGKITGPPLAFEKQANMDDWLIVTKIEDVCAGTAIPYNYDCVKF